MLTDVHPPILNPIYLPIVNPIHLPILNPIHPLKHVQFRHCYYIVYQFQKYFSYLRKYSQVCNFPLKSMEKLKMIKNICTGKKYTF